MQDVPIGNAPAERFQYLNEFLDILKGEPQPDDSIPDQEDTESKPQADLDSKRFLNLLESSMAGVSSSSIPKVILNFAIAAYHFLLLISKQFFTKGSLLPINLIKELAGNLLNTEIASLGILNEIFKRDNAEIAQILSNIIEVLLKHNTAGNNELSALFVKLFSHMGGPSPDKDKNLAAYYLDQEFEKKFRSLFSKENIIKILEITRLSLQIAKANDATAEELSKILTDNINSFLKDIASLLSEILIDHLLPLLVIEIRTIFYEDPKKLSFLEKHVLNMLNGYGIDRTNFDALNNIITEALNNPAALKKIIVSLLTGDTQEAITTIIDLDSTTNLDSVILLVFNSLPSFIPIIKALLVGKKYPIVINALEHTAGTLTLEKLQQYKNTFRNFYFATKLRTDAIKSIVDTVGATGDVAKKLQLALSNLSDEQLLLMTTENPNREKEIDRFLALDNVKKDILPNLPELKTLLMNAEVHIKQDLDEAAYRQKLFILNIAELLNDPDLKALVTTHILPTIARILTTADDQLTKEEQGIKKLLNDQGINGANFAILSTVLLKILEESGAFEELIGYFLAGDMQSFYASIPKLLPTITKTTDLISDALPLLFPIIEASIGQDYPMMIDVLKELNNEDFRKNLKAVLTEEKLQQFINIAKDLDLANRLRNEARNDAIKAIISVVGVKGDLAKKLESELNKLSDQQLLVMTTPDPSQQEQRKQEINNFLSLEAITPLKEQIPELTGKKILTVNIDIKPKLDNATIIQQRAILVVAKLLNDPTLKDFVIKHVLSNVNKILTIYSVPTYDVPTESEIVFREMLTDNGINAENFAILSKVLPKILGESGSFEELIGYFLVGDMQKFYTGIGKLIPTIVSSTDTLVPALPLLFPIIEAYIGTDYPMMIEVLKKLFNNEDFRKNLKAVLTEEKLQQFINIAKYFDMATKLQKETRMDAIKAITDIAASVGMNQEKIENLKKELNKLSDEQLLAMTSKNTNKTEQKEKKKQAIDSFLTEVIKNQFPELSSTNLLVAETNSNEKLADASRLQQLAILNAAALLNDPALKDLVINHILQITAKILACDEDKLSKEEQKNKNLLKNQGINSDNFAIVSTALIATLEKSESFEQVIGNFFVGDMQKVFVDVLELFGPIIPFVTGNIIPLLPILTATMQEKYPHFIAILKDKYFQNKLNNFFASTQQYLDIVKELNININNLDSEAIKNILTKSLEAITKLRKDAIEDIINGAPTIKAEEAQKLRVELNKLSDTQLLTITTQDPAKQAERKEAIAALTNISAETKATLEAVKVDIKEKLLSDPVIDLVADLVPKLLPQLLVILQTADEELTADELAIKNMLIKAKITPENFAVLQQVLTAALKKPEFLKNAMHGFLKGDIGQVVSDLLPLLPSVVAPVPSNLPLFIPIVDAAVGKSYPNVIKVIDVLVQDLDFQNKLTSILSEKKFQEYLGITQNFYNADKIRSKVIIDIANIIGAESEKAMEELKIELAKFPDHELLKIIEKKLEEQQANGIITKEKKESILISMKTKLELAANIKMAAILNALSLFQDQELIGLITKHVLPNFLKILSASDQVLTPDEIAIKVMLTGYGIDEKMCEMLENYLGAIQKLNAKQLNLLNIFKTIAGSEPEMKCILEISKCIEEITKSGKSLGNIDKNILENIFTNITGLLQGPEVKKFLQNQDDRNTFKDILNNALPVFIKYVLDKYKRCVADRFLMELKEIIKLKALNIKIPAEISAAFIKTQDIGILLKWAGENNIDIPISKTSIARFNKELAEVDKKTNKCITDTQNFLEDSLNFLLNDQRTLINFVEAGKKIINGSYGSAALSGAIGAFRGGLFNTGKIGINFYHIWSTLNEGTKDSYSSYEILRKELEVLNKRISSVATPEAEVLVLSQEIIKITAELKKIKTDLVAANEKTKKELIGKAADYICSLAPREIDRNEVIVKMRKFSLTELKDMFTTTDGVYNKDNKINPQDHNIHAVYTSVPKPVAAKSHTSQVLI